MTDRLTRQALNSQLETRIAELEELNQTLGQQARQAETRLETEMENFQHTVSDLNQTITSMTETSQLQTANYFDLEQTLFDTRKEKERLLESIDQKAKNHQEMIQQREEEYSKKSKDMSAEPPSGKTPNLE